MLKSVASWLARATSALILSNAMNCVAAIGVERSTAKLDGTITVYEVQEFLQSKNVDQVKKLEIRSKGGDVIAAIQLARWVAANSIDIEVVDVCASSCANYVFPAGRSKKIRDGALLIWHGGAFQRSFVGFAKQYEQALLRTKLNEASALDRREVGEGAERYLALMLNQSLERDFLKSIGVSHQLPTIGQEVAGSSLLWTLSVDQMESLGIRGVMAPVGYASEAYISDWQASNVRSDGGTRTSIRRIVLPYQRPSCD